MSPALDRPRWKSLRFLASPLCWIYGGIILLRNIAYNSGWIKVHTLPVPVISIGNLSTGGTGKTPVTLSLTQILADEPYRCKPAILSRGYGRAGKGYHLVSSGNGLVGGWQEAGDEPQLLALRLSHIPVAVDEDRVRGGRRLLQDYSPQVILLDDGFQHRRLHRDLDLVLLHAERDLNDYLLPAGMLREPLGSLRRAHLIALTNAQTEDPKFQRLWDCCLRLFGQQRLLACRSVPSGCRELRTGKKVKLGELSGKRLLPFCGIAHPDHFVKVLENLGVEVPFVIRFHDHHRYAAKDVEHLATAYVRTRADFLITTEKDAVKLEGLFAALPILVLQIEIEWLRGRENLERELDKLCGSVNGKIK